MHFLCVHVYVTVFMLVCVCVYSAMSEPKATLGPVILGSPLSGDDQSCRSPPSGARLLQTQSFNLTQLSDESWPPGL